MRAATLGGGIPAVSWARIAMAIVSARQSGGALLTIESYDQPLLVIDLDRHEFTWTGVADTFPASVSVRRVEQSPIANVALLGGYDLDILLWTVGAVAFGERQAGWLDPDSRVRLIGWPNLTVLDHTPEHVRMTASLGSAFMTASELAQSAGVEVGEAQRLINALGLMDLLRSAPIVDTASPDLPRTPRGLFKRLRDRLGI
jgi:hypothetical protein